MSLSKEELNFLRFCFLNMNIAPKAVRVYFDSVHSPCPLNNDIKKRSRTWKRLQFILNSRIQKLYPYDELKWAFSSEDLTMIFSLLQNTTPVPVTGWNILPHSGNKSSGADLVRVKWYWNFIAHKVDQKMSSSDFSQYWADLEGAIARLGGHSLLQESWSAKHIVIGKDMLNSLVVIDLKTFDNQNSFKEKHENQIQQLQDSLQKVKRRQITLLLNFLTPQD